MKVPLKSNDGSAKGTVAVPSVFEESIRPDIIKRAFESISANDRQPFGTKPYAGRRQSARISKRRRDYRGCYGQGISRTPRKVMSRRGIRLNFVGAVAPNTVGGRRAHPPKVEKIYTQKINTKERQKAIRSAIAATFNVEYVQNRGHSVPSGYPFIVDSSFEQISKTKDVVASLEKLGFNEEMIRTAHRSVRAGVGKLRGRKYKQKTGLLVVTAHKSPLVEAISNIPGFSVVSIDRLNARVLAPGGIGGRLTLYTTGAVERLEKEGLFGLSPKKAIAAKKTEKKN